MSMTSVAPSPAIEESLDFPGCLTTKFSKHSNESILIFLTVGGAVIPMHVMESDSIVSVKLRIQSSRGIFVNKQKLVFGGRELAWNNSCIRDYGVSDRNVLHLVVKLSEIQAITVRTVCGKTVNFQVERYRNVGYVKQQLAKKGRSFADLHDQELVCDGEELEDQRLVMEICKNKDAVLHLLVRKSAKIRARPVSSHFELYIEALNLDGDGCDVIRGNKQQSPSVDFGLLKRNLVLRDFFLEPLTVNPTFDLPSVIKKLIASTLDGLEKGHEPIRSPEGSGGAYLMQDSSGHTFVSVFKPIDEEPMAVNNPRGLPMSLHGEGLKKGTRVGEGALREVAAYILDHPVNGNDPLCKKENGFSGVPPTVMVRCLHRGFNYPEGYTYALKNAKVGSLQMFVKNSGSCEDMGPRAFPVDEVHKISVLDIRLANADRHAGNILAARDCDSSRIILVPIDHGYCLPENFEDCTFEWLYWPQAQEQYSPAILDYVKSLDAEEDIKLLKFHGWDMPPRCARTFRISTMLLKKGAERGLTPFSIGSIMCRKTLKEASVIERIVQAAEQSVVQGTGENAVLEAVAAMLDSYLDQLQLGIQATRAL